MLILIAHGSYNAEWRAAVEAVTAGVNQDANGARVRLAYMDCTPPTLMDVAREALRDGVGRLDVLPLFLADEGHVDRDVRPLVAEVQAAYPRADVRLLPAVGQHPLFGEMLRGIAAELSTDR